MSTTFSICEYTITGNTRVYTELLRMNGLDQNTVPTNSIDTEVSKGDTRMTKRNNDAKTIETCALNLNIT